MPRKKSNSHVPLKDMCQTPIYALAPVFEKIKKSRVFYKGCRIWEPFAGEGIIVKSLLENNFRVVHSDIKYTPKEDFFKLIKNPPRFDLIISNPPFSKKYKIIEELYNLGKPFFLLVPVDTCGAAAAQNLFKKYGVEKMWVSPRINFKMPVKGWDCSKATFSTLWLHWDGIKNPNNQKSSYWTIDPKGPKE